MTRGLYFNITALLAVAAFSFGWAAAVGFALPSVEFFALQLLVTAVFGSVALIYFFLRPDPQVTRLMLNIVLGFWFLGVVVLFSYLCATIDRPLVDTQLAAVDQALGIDWPAMVGWASRQLWITEWARFVYDRPMSELLIIVPALAILGRADRVEELVSCFIISAVITASLGAMLPADSGYAYFGVPAEVFERLKAVVTPEYLAHFHALRAGEMRSLIPGDIRGLVAFPSYHTAFALLLVYAVRGYRFLFYPILVLNLAVVSTTPFVGAHYVTDIIGGLAVVAFTVWAVVLLTHDRSTMATKAVPQPALQA